MHNKVKKFEAPARLAELAPQKTLLSLGLQEGKSFCDIGAGTGIFTFAARQITSRVFALEMNEELLEYMRSKAKQNAIYDIEFLKTTATSLEMPAASCDVALLCTVLHELEQPKVILEQIKTMLTPQGILGVIEFHKKETPIGPPVAHRIDAHDAAMLVEASGLPLQTTQLLGENLYLQVFQQSTTM